MPTYLLLTLGLSGVGILNTLYLSWHTVTGQPVKCLFFPHEWCRKVQYNKRYNRTFGIPNSFAGFALYSLIFILTLLYGMGSVSLIPVFGLVGLGFLFSLYFLFIQAFVLEAFCTWCVLSALDFTLMVAILIINFS
jgi:uncharacterized membrane protein